MYFSSTLETYHFYKRYVDDTFVIFNSKEDSDAFFKYLNSQNRNIKFTKEEENDHQLPFLDVCVKRELDGTLSTSVYRKPTYSGLLMKYDSFVPIEFKRSLIYGLVNRAWRICSSETNFQRDVDYVKCLFSATGYPKRFVVKCVKTVINRKSLGCGITSIWS